MTAYARRNLVVFYSFEGNCRTLGGVIAETIDADAAEIFPVREISRSFAMKYFSGGKGSLFKEKTEIQPLSVDVRDYGLVFVGTPVWAWNIPPATRTFLEGQDWSGVKTALYAMHRGGAGFALSTMRKIIEGGGGTVVGAETYFDLRHRNAQITKTKASEWASAMAQRVMDEAEPEGYTASK